MLEEFIKDSYSEKAVAYINDLHKRREEKERLRKEKIEMGKIDKIGRVCSYMISNEEWEERKNLILNSGIDITKYGWLSKVEKVTSLSGRIIENTLRRFPETFEGKYFKRKA